jgi:hypothetical protein
MNVGETAAPRPPRGRLARGSMPRGRRRTSIERCGHALRHAAYAAAVSKKQPQLRWVSAHGAAARLEALAIGPAVNGG